MKYLTLVFAAISMFIGGCASGTGAPVNDAEVTLGASIATTGALIALGTQNPTSVAPAAKEAYEVASAINVAAKNGVSAAEIEALAQTYLGQTNPGYAPLIGEVIQLIELGAGTPTPAASTQPSTGQYQELIEDLSLGVMEGSEIYTGATPTAETMGLEQRGKSAIQIRHFVWRPR